MNRPLAVVAACFLAYVLLASRGPAPQAHATEPAVTAQARATEPVVAQLTWQGLADSARVFAVNFPAHRGASGVYCYDFVSSTPAEPRWVRRASSSEEWTETAYATRKDAFSAFPHKCCETYRFTFGATLIRDIIFAANGAAVFQLAEGAATTDRGGGGIRDVATLDAMPYWVKDFIAANGMLPYRAVGAGGAQSVPGVWATPIQADGGSFRRYVSLYPAHTGGTLTPLANGQYVVYSQSTNDSVVTFEPRALDKYRVNEYYPTPGGGLNNEASGRTPVPAVSGAPTTLTTARVTAGPTGLAGLAGLPGLTGLPGLPGLAGLTAPSASPSASPSATVLRP
jgi:hypothetical protein